MYSPANIKNLLLAFSLTNQLFSSVRSASDIYKDHSSFDCEKTKLAEVSNKCSNTKMSEDYKAGETSVLFVTTPDEHSAKKIAHGVVEKQLAACVNIIPQIQSIYMWEGKVNEDNELLLMIKTRTNRVEELTKWVRENHPYSVAEVISIPIEQGNAPYLKWIKDVVPNKPN